MKTNRLLTAAGMAAAAVLATAGPAVAATTATAADAALTSAIDRYSYQLGVPRDASAQVAAAGLPSRIAGDLAGELNQLYACDAITRSNTSAVLALFPYGPGLPLGVPAVFPYPAQTQGVSVLGVPITQTPLPNPQVPENFPFQDDVQACGQASVAALQALRADLQASSPDAMRGLDVWPVLNFQPSTTGHHTYTHDYVLQVDDGSYNTYLNNAGGNALDIWRGPAGSGARYVAPARGCIDAFDIIRAETCTLASAALLDLGSHNTFGQLQAPDPATDGMCTRSAVEPRVFVQGTGVAGVGILIDEGSDNTFTGKVLTDGTGHIGGYGYLRVDGDGNRFTAVRDAFGDAVVGGIGTLVLNGDGNAFDTYMPAPINASAPAGTLGSGGVVDDLNNCDAGTGTTLGAGEVGGVGVFSAHSTHGNSYVAPRQSLGSGLVGGSGTFTTTGGGTDSYSGPGAAGRANGVTIAPTSTDDGTFSDS
jgi:hypothetical protein